MPVTEADRLNLLTGMLRKTGGTLAGRGGAIDAAVGGAPPMPTPMPMPVPPAMTQSQFAGAPRALTPEQTARQAAKLADMMRARGDTP